MKRRLKEPFGKAGLTVAILALVMALVGGAYAAGGLNSTQKKEVKKIAMKYAGKPGASGATGPAGAVGPAGPAGAAGKAGKEGPQGLEGKEGSPWTAGGTLPKGSSEKGVWAATPYELNALFGSIIVGKSAISFGIPLSTTPSASYVNGSGEEGVYNEATEKVEFGTATHCLGTTEAPKAAEGFLCVYGEFLGTPLEPRSRSVGAVVGFEGPEGFPLQGTWAVTGS
jgi:hypothetical protein